MKYAHTNIVCRDWRKLSKFYIDTFECEILPPTRKQAGEWLSKGVGVKDASLEGVHLLLPGHGRNGPTLEIYQYSNFVEQHDLAPNTRGYGHLAFEVDNVDEVLAKLLNNGGSRLGETTSHQVDGVGEITFVYCRDPEGNPIELQSWIRTQECSENE